MSNFFGALWKMIKDSISGGRVSFQGRTMRLYAPTMIAITLLVGIPQQFTVGEWVIIAILAIIITSAETMNTAIEFVCDEVAGGPLIDEDGVTHEERRRTRIKKAKDLGSFAVFVFNVLAVAVIIFFIICHLFNWPWWSHLFP